MLKIDDNLLQQIGLGALPAEEKRNLLAHIYETLEMRVGMRLADQMTNEQLDEFEMYFEAKDDAGAFKWLEANFPNYKDIVNDEFEKLKVEVQQSAPQILGAAQANPTAVQPSDQTAGQQLSQQLPPQPVLPQQPPVQTQPQYQPPQLAQQYAADQYQPPATPTTPQYQPAPGFDPQNAAAPAQPYAAPPQQPQQPMQPAPQPPQQPAPQPWTPPSNNQ